MPLSWAAPLPASQPLPISEYITFAHRLADVSGDAIRPYFGHVGTIESKSDDSPVTLADKAAEAQIRALIDLHYPEHGIYGEEHGHHGADRRYVWVIDPIDGTRAFIAGKKEWGTLIALCENGIPILGMMNQPITGERWVGAQGQLTTLNGMPVRTRACTGLAQASISSTSAAYFTPPQAKQFVTLAGQCAETIENGDCYAYGLLASGQRDLVVDAGLKPYDILALVPIIEGAGGVVSHWDDKPVRLDHYRDVLAAGNATLHAAALSTLTAS